MRRPWPPRIDRCRCATGGLGAFPSPGSARVLWYGVADPDGRLAALAGDLTGALGLDGRGPFRPHVTLARARREPVDLRRWLGAAASAPEGVLVGRRRSTDAQPPRQRPRRGMRRWRPSRSGVPVRCLSRSRALRPPFVAVIGDGDPRGPDAHRILEWAEEVGSSLARGGATVVTGGLGGVMRAASRGARGGRRPDDRHPARRRCLRGQRVRRVPDRDRASASCATWSSSPQPMPWSPSAAATARCRRSAWRCGWGATW